MMNLIIGVALTLIIQHIPSDVKEIEEDIEYQKKPLEPYQVANEWNKKIKGGK